MTNLYDHQKKIIDEDKKKCGLWLGTGSAKTLTALHLAKGKILVITPKTQKEEENFKREAKKFGLDKNITSLSKEQFKKVAHTLPRFDTVIVDEAHTVAGVTTATKQRRGVISPRASQLFDTLYTYLQENPPERLYFLTATPIRSAMSVYALGILLGYKWNYHEWRDAFYTRISQGYREFWIPRKTLEVKERLGRIVQTTGYTGRLEDYFDVPTQIYKTIHIELTDAQKKRLKEIPIEYPEPIVQIGKLHQVENGVLGGDEFNKEEEFANNKIEKILDLALEFPQMVIFAKYTAQIKSIVSALTKADYKVLTLTGQTKNRDEVLKEANSSKNCILVCQSQISAGWEVPTYPCMVFASMTYSVVDRIQAEGRILRANNLKKNIFITLVVKGGIDEAVAKAIESKEDFIEKIYVEKRSTVRNKI